MGGALFVSVERVKTGDSIRVGLRCFEGGKTKHRKKGNYKTKSILKPFGEERVAVIYQKKKKKKKKKKKEVGHGKGGEGVFHDQSLRRTRCVITESH